MWVTSSKQKVSSSLKPCAAHVNVYYCADLQCILFIVLLDQSKKCITVKVEEVQAKGLVRTNRGQNPLLG